MDAIQSAGTPDPQALNTAIGKTNKTYVVGPVDFATGPGGHTSTLPSFMLQWQNGQEQAIYPSRQATSKLIYPLPSWRAVASYRSRLEGNRNQPPLAGWGLR